MKDEVKKQWTVLNNVGSLGILFALPSSFIPHPCPSAFILHPSSLPFNVSRRPLQQGASRHGSAAGHRRGSSRQRAAFTIVCLPEVAVKESKDRVRSALL